MLYSTESRQTAIATARRAARAFKRRIQRRKVLAVVIPALRPRVRRYTAHRRFQRRSCKAYFKFLRADEDDREFRSFYRLPKKVFDTVLERIRCRIERDETKQKAAAGEDGVIEPETMLAVTLRWLAGAFHV